MLNSFGILRGDATKAHYSIDQIFIKCFKGSQNKERKDWVLEGWRWEACARCGNL